ncbi:siderophore-interacting protein [Iodobacter fluviatilis]|uniref:NADPH-dependent ferric siderophore reductase n=1 Tax=Iodobacter fluviatilis TaxID=537 RepID=A0A377Q9B6_9NEIS|nr:siderophore-interacting protein [Iodobacter fluviatilis]TCU81769.1 NADPH-dependent ferric siderophore reductase [Iodobacter fluviatilis]STQ91876.1 Vibriobactin utilization protein ViuB [Iodobacter fluviatilis]
MSQESSPKQAPRKLQVLQSLRLTPHLQRLTLGGPGLNGFPNHCDGAHIKLLLPQQGQALMLPTAGPKGLIWPPAQNRPVVRTYTVRHFDAMQQTLTVDFVIHDEYGPASYWAQHAQIGDDVGLAGPSGPARLNPAADYFLLAGDLSALPAISTVLEALPENAVGTAFIEITSEADQQHLSHPAGVNIVWLVNSTPSALLPQAVFDLPWPQGSVSATIAGETEAVVQIRKYLRINKRLSVSHCYIVPYWKYQHSEEAYHDERHRIMDEVLTPA